MVVERSETKEHDRSGPIPPGCLALLRDMPARIDSPWLFPTATGRTWRINNFYRDVWRPARRASGLESRTESGGAQSPSESNPADTSDRRY